MSLLTNSQKSSLAFLAQRAFRLECAKARGRGEAVNDSAEAFALWRHQIIERAVGKAGLRCCTQFDYNGVKAAFEDLLGETGKALNTQMRGETEKRRQAEYKLMDELRKSGFNMVYLNTICRAQYGGKPIEDITTDQIWQLVFTIRNRASRKRKKEQEKVSASHE